MTITAARRRAARIAGLMLAAGASGTLGLALRAAPAAAGAWMRGPGHSYTKVSITRLAADERLDPAGDAEPLDNGGRFEDIALYVYDERGLQPWLDLVTSLAAKRVGFTDVLGSDQSTAGLGDLELALRAGAWRRGPLMAAALAGVKLPLGYDAADTPPLGSGQPDLELRALLSSSLHPWLQGYVTGEIGYRWRAQLADEVPYFFEAGFELGRGTWVRGALIGVDSRGARQQTDPELPPELTVREEDLLKLGPGLVLPLEPWLALEVGYWAVVRGKNTIRSRELSIGVSFVESE